MANCYISAFLCLVFVTIIADGTPGGCPNATEKESYNPKADVESLKNAVDHKDGERIIDVVTGRTRQERLEIVEAYETAYGEDLMEKLNSVLTGNFKQIIAALMTPIHDYYAQELNYAIWGEDVDVGSVIEILTTLNDSDVYAVEASYERLYGGPLKWDLKVEKSKNFQSFIDALFPVSSRRDDHETSFRSMIEGRSDENLREIFDISRKEFEGCSESEVFDFVWNSLSELDEYFARRLIESLRREYESDDRTLIRIIVTRSEIDLPKIMETFHDNYGHSLRLWIEDKTTGDYRKALLSIIERVVDKTATTARSKCAQGSFNN